MHYVQFRNQMTNANDEDLMALAMDIFGAISFVVGTGYSVVQNSPTGMSVLVNDGVAYNYSSTLGYHMRSILDTFAVTASKAVLTIDSNSSGSTRYDLICIRIDTAAIADADASNIASLVVVKGTPGAGVPATPANYHKLAEITVADGATTIATAQITDRRKWAPIIVVPSGSNADIELNPLGTGVIKAKTTVQLTPYGVSTDQDTGDGKVGFEILPELNGFNLVGISGSVDTAGTTGTADFQIRRVRSGTPADMLSTKLTIDSGEISSSTAATPAVINASNDDVATGDILYVDQDAKHTTAAKGGHISLTFAKP